MTENSRGFLFRKRNILGAALLAGIGLGVYLGRLNFGWGGGNKFGIGSSDGETQATISSADPIKALTEPANQEDLNSIPVSNVVRVLIDNYQFLLRGEKGDAKTVPVDLKKLMELVQAAEGDEDGIRLKIYRNDSTRASSEEKLKQALAEAGVADTAVFWVPTSDK